MNSLSNGTRRCSVVIIFLLALAVVLGLTGCGGGSNSAQSLNPNVLGHWTQVNFLADDDNGVWGPDDYSGIGFVLDVTNTTWTETDDYGHGASVAFTYSINNSNRYVKDATYHGVRIHETGRLVFDGNVMIEYFDPQPGDTIVAFKWVKSP